MTEHYQTRERPPETANTGPSTLFEGIRRVAITGLAIAVWIGGFALPAQAQGAIESQPGTDYSPQSSASALTRQGQQSFDAGDYIGAATSWRRILDILPENPVNREERENALLITLEAYKEGFRRAQLQKTQVSEADIELLRTGLALCSAYTAEFTRIHGSTALLSPAVIESRTELEAMLARAGGTPPPPVVEQVFTPDPGPQIERDVIRRGPSGVGLIVAGSVTTVAGLAMIPLIAIGAVRAQDAEQDLSDANEQMDDAAAADAEQNRRSANAMLITGSVLAGVFTIGGVTMLGIGIRRRIRYTAFAPSVGPAYVGLSLRGRF